MKTSFNVTARKRPVNLTLNEDLVSQAKSMTANLSGVVESLLSEFVERESRERLIKTKVVEAKSLRGTDSMPSRVRLLTSTRHSDGSV